jgi:hypothetical protein
MGIERAHRLRVEGEQPHPVLALGSLADIAALQAADMHDIARDRQLAGLQVQVAPAQADTSPARSPVVAHNRRNRPKVGSSCSAAARASRTSAGVGTGRLSVSAAGGRASRAGLKLTQP